MCEKHYYYEDGRKVHSQIEQCSKAARHGPNTICEEEEPSIFRHLDGEAPRRNPQYLSPGFPFIPPWSNISFAPLSGGERSHKRRSGTYLNGEKVSRSNSRREKRGSAYVTFAEPSTSLLSSSPSRSPTYIYHSSISPSYTSHDQLYYSRPEVRLEVNRPRRNSTIQYEQQILKPKVYSFSSSSEEERMRQKLKREEKKNKEAKRQIAEGKLENKIKRQNATIEDRPPIVKTAIPYRRGSVSIKQSNSADPYVSRSSYNYSVQQDSERIRRKEQEAQEARLRARLLHSGYDRPTVVYHRDSYQEVQANIERPVGETFGSRPGDDQTHTIDSEQSEAVTHGAILSPEHSVYRPDDATLYHPKIAGRPLNGTNANAVMHDRGGFLNFKRQSSSTSKNPAVVTDPVTALKVFQTISRDNTGGSDCKRRDLMAMLGAKQVQRRAFDGKPTGLPNRNLLVA